MKIHKRIFAYSCLLIFAVVLLSAHAEADKDKYVLALNVKSNAGMDGQTRVVFTDVAKIFSRESGRNLVVKFYTDTNELMSDIRKKSVDMLFFSDMQVNYNLIKQKKMTPFISMKLFGKEGHRACLYAKKKNNYKNINDLKGKRVITYRDSLDAYYTLRKLTKGTPPENVFSLKTSPNAFSMIYALGLDDADAIYINEFNVEYFKMTNPGPVKDIAQIACSEAVPNWAVMKSPDLPDDFARALQSFMINAPRNEALKQYRPMMKQVAMSYNIVTAENFKSLVALIDEGKKLGWDKDYETWMRYQKSE